MHETFNNIEERDPELAQSIATFIATMGKYGYAIFDLDWLLTALAFELTDNSDIAELCHIQTNEIRQALVQLILKLNFILEILTNRFGLQHPYLISYNRYAIITILRCIPSHYVINQESLNLFFYWFFHCLLWERYKIDPKTKITEDIKTFNYGGPQALIDDVIQKHHKNRLTVDAQDFNKDIHGGGVYSFLYSMTSKSCAKDWETDRELVFFNTFSSRCALLPHYIFPPKQLKLAGYSDQEINHIANIVFVSRQTIEECQGALPELYMPKYLIQNPETINSNWIPIDNIALFDIKNYKQFLEQRMKLLAEEANEYLNLIYNVYDLRLQPGSENIASEQIFQKNNDKIPDLFFQTLLIAENQISYPYGEYLALFRNKNIDKIQKIHRSLNYNGIINYELFNKTGDKLITFDIAWNNGIRPNENKKVALLLDGKQDDINIAKQNGYTILTSANEDDSYLRSI